MCRAAVHHDCAETRSGLRACSAGCRKCLLGGPCNPLPWRSLNFGERRYILTTGNKLLKCVLQNMYYWEKSKHAGVGGEPVGCLFKKAVNLNRMVKWVWFKERQVSKDLKDWVLLKWGKGVPGRGNSQAKTLKQAWAWAYKEQGAWGRGTRQQWERRLESEGDPSTEVQWHWIYSHSQIFMELLLDVGGCQCLHSKINKTEPLPPRTEKLGGETSLQLNKMDMISCGLVLQSHWAQSFICIISNIPPSAQQS